MTEPAVSIHGISHAYGSHQALDALTFDIPPHSFFGLLGPNGSGKTTLFRILSTLMPPAAGHCAVMGFDTVKQAREVRQHIGMIFQQPSLDEALTVLENLTFHGRMYGIETAALRTRIEELASRLDVADRLHSRVSSLSGGLKRRVDLVRGILHRPRVLLLDEPTTALDPVARHSFWQLLATLRREENLTLVLATHLLEEADSCAEIVILDKGRIALRGNPDELRDRLGEQVLWLTSSSLDELERRLNIELGFSGRRTPNAISISGEKAVQSLPRIYESMGALIDSATIRRPTLEDVFLATTGRAFEDIQVQTQK